MTRTNTIVGTPFYMAPEQERGEVRRESDLYSLGVCFYEMLTGKLPFETGVIQFKKEEGKFTPVTEIVRDLPPEIDSMMSKVLSPLPENRYHTAPELLNALSTLT